MELSEEVKISARTEIANLLYAAGLQPDEINFRLDAYASELAAKIRDVDNWNNVQQYAPTTRNTYRAFARRAAKEIEPHGR